MDSTIPERETNGEGAILSPYVDTGFREETGGQLIASLVGALTKQ
jgi:hypothetical protein